MRDEDKDPARGSDTGAAHDAEGHDAGAAREPGADHDTPPGEDAGAPPPGAGGAATRSVLGSASEAFELQLFQQVAETLYLAADNTPELHTQVITAAFEAMKHIAPQSELEGMLAGQMVAGHNAAMECLRRANLPEQSLAGLDLNLKHAAKLMSLYERQLAALDKHRGRGRQKITVEHVHVHSGGQAIVGDVHTGGAEDAPRAAPAAAVPAALTDQSQADAIGRGVMDELARAKVPAPLPARRTGGG